MDIAPLNVRDESGFRQVLDIYRQAIDPTEQKTEADLRAMRRRASCLMLAAREGAVVTGFAILFAPPDADFAMLEYMAVAAHARGAGLGERLFGASLRAVSDRTLLIEIEQEEAGRTGAELRRRRLGFYDRLGCKRLGSIDYQLPLRTNGLPPPLLLAAHGRTSAVPREAVHSWLTRAYVDVYAQAADDPRIEEMLAGEGDPVPLTSLRPGLPPMP